jgi:hypothetical protein
VCWGALTITSNWRGGGRTTRSDRRPPWPRTRRAWHHPPVGTRAAGWRARAGGILAVLAVAAGGCANGTVDPKVIEQGIQDQVVVGTTTVEDANCPDDVQSEKGATFKCDVLFHNGAGGQVQVIETRLNHFTYKPVPGSLQVPGAAVEPDIEQALAQQGVSDPSVNCPDNIIVKVGTYVVCEFKGANGGAGTVKFTFSSTSGEVDSSSVDAT